jgi:hypothetical protein
MTSYERQGTGFDPGATGHELQGRDTRPPPPAGNLAAVYAEFWQTLAIAGDVEAAINSVVERSGADDAEIGDGEARWFLVQTYAGDDLKAMRWLARRKFGVFRPMKQREDKRNGAKLQGWEAAFPGWLLVLTWDIERMANRIVSTIGVMSILSHRISLAPQSIPDWFVDKLRVQSFEYNDRAPRAQYGRLYHEAERQVQRHRKGRKRKGKRIKAKNRRGDAVHNASLTESGGGVTQPRPAVAGSPSGCG